MTSDSLIHRPTESLILPNKRRFFPLKIPNFHLQLRHYISTADPDRIYVVVDRIIVAIHIAAQKRESIAVIPFEPRCLAAGHGWIAVGGPENGECAYIRIDESELQVHDETYPPRPSDVDSALPLDLEPPSRPPSPGASGSASARRPPRRLLPELILHKFGGSIVNSVTIHRFPGNGEGTLHEDVMVLSNNDHTVTVYSLTRSKVLKIIQHSTCMNYTTISPDQTILAAVGDENRVYFYRILRDWGPNASIETDGRLAGWEWEELKCIEIEIGTRVDDACCFTIAFSPSSHLCAIGSQSGVITVIDVEVVRQASGSAESDENPILYQFLASRPCQEGGAVRCMTFSPEPWDLLVWLEGQGRAGIADVRQFFVRRQILDLSLDDPQLQAARLEPMGEDSDEQSMDDDDLAVLPPPPPRLRIHGDDTAAERGLGEADRSSARENIMQDLSERERLIMDFLNTARWTSRLEERLTERPERPARTSLHPHHARTRHYDPTDGVTRSSHPSSPPNQYDSSEIARDVDSELFLPPPPPPPRMGHSRRANAPSERSYHARRQSSIVVSQGNRPTEVENSNLDPQPSLTLSWTTSPSELLSTGSDITSRALDSDLVDHENDSGPRTPEAIGPSPVLDLGISSEALARLRPQRSSSTPRRTERPQTATERRYDPSRLSNYEIRANVAAERLRRQQRPIPNEVHNRSSIEREQRHRQHFLGFEQTHSPRWIRNIINDLPDRNSVNGSGANEPDATAGLGWGADGRTLYLATVEGIFEYQLNIHDRRTFPSISYR
ncbi:hypothetical protein N7466_001758 [Penicillium verhagenii]|uniref:uncharacterized protein n=1 Tax=Penicillium verhagenii TaxID=1562060 RepID=UPI0025452999|nr:uncharacterized protein N7466_001758 [Penicillium verhagenii]KAJ5938624.1 hypothetical protein N7466_001758 [Penicillium verhagenii]